MEKQILKNDYMTYVTSIAGDWSRIQLSPNKIDVTPEASLHINAKDITLNIPEADTVDMNWIEKTFLNKKENKKMSDIKLLEIYRERAKEKIDDDYVTEKCKILEKDTIQNIIEEMENQVNAILESEESDNRLHIHKDYIVTKETQEKLKKLDKDTKLKNEKLSNTIGEIYAMFELTENYEERMKILKKYGIINKDGKLGA